MADLDITGRVVVDASQAESAFDKIGDKAEQMAREVSGAAGKAGQAVDKIGDGAGASAERFTRAESRIQDSIKRTTTSLELLGKTASQKLEFKINEKGLDPAKFEPALVKLREIEAQSMRSGVAANSSLNSMGMSAKATAAALRGVPAQFTDIAVSLQGGQKPLTVLLQQGGQLKDMFGGAGNAAKALGGYVAGLINPFTLTAAAVGALAYAYFQGSKEADAYNKSIITTGNAAGTTAAQMQQMAQRIGSVVGTQGAAADALAKMAGSSRIAAQNFEYFGEVALKVEKTVGTSVAETVKQFAELGKSPVDASKKLNEETNYLTQSVYEQIKALKEQGREADAASVAQKAWADALNNRSAEMTQNLGLIEKAWRGVAGAAKGAWDAMLNVGRSDSLEGQLSRARDELEARMARGPLNSQTSGSFDIGNERLKQTIAYLGEQERMLQRGATAQAERAQAEKAAIEATDALGKANEKAFTKQEQMNKALDDYRANLEKVRAVNPNSALLDPAQISKSEKAIREQFAERTAAVRKGNDELQKQAALIAKLSGLDPNFSREWEMLSKAYKSGALSLDQLIVSQASLLAKQPAITAEMKAQEEAIKAINKANESAAAARDKYIVSLDTGLEKIQADIAAQIESTARMGLSKTAIAELDAAKLEMLATDTELQAVHALDRNLDEQTYAALKKQAAAYRDLAKAKQAGAAKETALDLEKANADAAKKAADEWQKTADSINNSLTDALMRGFESGKDFAKNLRDTVVNMFKTMVLRPVISAVLSPVSGAIAGVMGGGQSSGGVMGGVQTASNAYSLYNNGSSLYSLGSQYLGGTMSGANALGSVYANATGTGLDGLLATNGAYGTAGATGGSAISGAVASAGYIAVVAAVAAAFGAFAKTEKVGSGYQGTLDGSSALTNYGLMRTGGSLFGGPQYDFVNPEAELKSINDRLAVLDKSGSLGSWDGEYTYLTGRIERLTNEYGDSIEATSVFSKQLQKSYADMRENTAKMADSLGLSGEKIRDFAFSLNTSSIADTGQSGLKINDLTSEEVAAKLAEVFATANNDMAEQLIGTWDTVVSTITKGVTSGIAADGYTYGTETTTTSKLVYTASEYAKDGEKAIDTLTRLATSLGTVNGMWDALGYSMNEASLAGANAASNIVDAFGGLEAFSQTIGSYFNSFYSDAERKSATARQVAKTLGDAGLTVDASQLENITRPAIRAFVDSIGTQFGLESEQYVTAVQQANVLATIIEPIDQLTQSAAALDTSAQDAARAAEDALKAWQQITDGLLSSGVSLAIELLRTQGKEEEALAMERSRAIDGMDAYQVGLYDANTGTRALIDSLVRMQEISTQLADELPGVISKYLTPEQNTANSYSAIAGDLIKAGLSGMGAGELTQALTGASKDEIAQAAAAIYNMTGVTDEMRLALVRAAGSLADLKDAALDTAKAGTDAAYSALEQSVNARKTLLQESITDINAVFEAVRDNAKSLYGEVDSTAKQMAAQGRAFIDNALSNAQATGYLPDATALKTAISDARAGISGTQYATQFEADRERLVLAGKLTKLQDISGDQLTEAEKQLAVLDGILENARAQIDSLRGINAGVIGVQSAIAALAAAMAIERAASGIGGAAATPASQAAAQVLNGSNGAQVDLRNGIGYQSTTGLPYMVDDIRAAAADLVNAGNGLAVYDAIKSQGFTLDQADAILGLGAGTAEDWAKAMGLPVFHSGTDYVPKTGLALLQQGEAVIPAAMNRGDNNARLESLVEGLTAEVKRLQGLVAQGNEHQRTTADLLDNVTEGGNAMRQTALGGV